GLDLCEQPIKMGEARHVALYADRLLFKFLYGCIQLRLTAPRDENESAFADELSCRCQTDTAGATGNECNLSFALAPQSPPWHSSRFFACDRRSAFNQRPKRARLQPSHP